MLATCESATAQGTKDKSTAPSGAPLISAADALEIARERFTNLCCGGILPRKAVGEPVDLADIEIALVALAQCRKTKTPTVHTFDLRRAMPGDVQLGAVIAASVALGFATHSWFGVTTFAPHALVAINQSDVRRVAMATRRQT
jgi:hypothetical protein